ncbi:hypothetical protein DSO57_1019544 [Entomophthora muscae]|uniref:Uncharacterized protein n=1 Tax=Entomophthora muscae TaxID=34485 RepID=A0ACC2S5W0_9FUNG|nr:hypothetical protein DSO57_1019544 [Entomophthora muscae]
MQLASRQDLKVFIKRHKNYLVSLALLWALGLFWRVRGPLRLLWERIFSQSKKTIPSKKSSKKKLLSISLDKIVLQNTSKDPAIPSYVFVESSLPTLCRLCEQYDVYLIATVKSILEQKQVEELIISSALSVKHQLDIRKVVFCQSSTGRSHIVRHLEPHIHVDNELAVIKQLSFSISRLILIISQSNGVALKDVASTEKLSRNIDIVREFTEACLL